MARLGMDGHLWAMEFMKRIIDKKVEIDEGLMISWFCNAIMAGYDQGRRDEEGIQREMLGDD